MIIKDKLEKLENELDFDFDIDKKRINTLEKFEKNLVLPYKEGKKIFYRGERKDDINRPLLPSIFRNREFLFENKNRVNLINAQFLYNYYSKLGPYMELYEKIIGKADTKRMYPFLAFSQHYLGLSPLIDFSKSPYACLSFALKDRKEYEEDILIYTLEIKNDEDYTSSVETANEWINNYSVLVFRDVTRRELEKPLERLADYKTIADNPKGANLFEMNTPRAKLIDVPTNDLMLYQQGVFLLLDDFSLMRKSYLTKKIRDDFKVKKWLINKEICPALYDMLIEENPYYSYKYITNLTSIADDIKKKL